MVDLCSKQKRSQIMAAIRSRGNKGTELKFASILRAAGLIGWRRHQNLPGRPDFIFRRARIAVFIDGCFWHCCPKHMTLPKTNVLFWKEKLKANKERDKIVVAALRRAGWHVMRIWEHDLAHCDKWISRIEILLKSVSTSKKQICDT